MATTGCTFIATQATLIQYEPGDGVGVDIGNVQVRNAIALINTDGRAVSLLITFVNSGDHNANIKVQYESGGEKTEIIKSIVANSVASYGNTPDETQIIILNPGVKAGGLLPVYLQYGDHEGKQLMVPVMNADYNEEYKDLVPPEIER